MSIMSFIERYDTMPIRNLAIFWQSLIYVLYAPWARFVQMHFSLTSRGRWCYISCVTDNADEEDRDEFLKEAEVMKILPKHPNVVALLGCCTIQGILIFSLIDHLSFVKFMTKSVSKQECIPVDAYRLQQWPSAGGRGQPQCMLGYTHPLDLGLDPPGCGPGAPFPLGASLETPQPDPSTSP